MPNSGAPPLPLDYQGAIIADHSTVPLIFADIPELPYRSRS